MNWYKIALVIGMLILLLFVPVTSAIAQFTAPARCDTFAVKQRVVVRGWVDGIPRRVTEAYVDCEHYSVVPQGDLSDKAEG